MPHWKDEFIDFLLQVGALQFGKFVLKSGREAPYFFNSGAFSTGENLAKLGKFYAQALQDLSFDVLYGPAYKGIPLCVTTSIALSQHFGKNVSYAFNRKEAKAYGQKDRIIGAIMTSDTKIVLIDDVITAGTSLRESITLLREYGNPRIVSIVVALDRQEKNNEGRNALKDIEETCQVPIRSLVTLDDIIQHISLDDMESLKSYRRQYGI